MNVYSISYDLRQPTRDYTSLYEEIKKMGDYFHPLESNWFVRTNWDAQDIYDKLRPYIDDNDLILIIRVDHSDKQGWMVKNFWEWLRK